MRTDLIRQLGKFAVVGAGNTLVSLASFAVLSRAGLGDVSAAALAFALGAANGYAWNRSWTFAGSRRRSLPRYLVVQLAGLGLTTAGMDALATLDLGGLPAYLGVTAVVTVTTFAGNRRWAFATHSDLTEPSKRLRKPVQDAGAMNTFAPHIDSTAPAVEIVVPVYDEETTLERSITRLCSYLEHEFPFSFQITIADNASRDRTLQIARDLSRRLDRVQVLHLEQKGRGRALRAAWSRSDAAVVAYMDVDLSTDLDALLPLVAPLLSGHSDVAIGSRLSGGARVERGIKRELISRVYNLILHTVLRVRFSDAQCGFKAVRGDRVRQLLPLIEDDAWFFDTELLVQAERLGLRIHEVPVDWVDDADSRVDIVSTAIADLRGVRRLLFHRVAPPARPAGAVRLHPGGHLR
jgi:putative flippase GtrA